MVTPVNDASPCDVVYTPAPMQDSDGAPCRVINYNRTVPRNTFIRVRFCGCDGCEEPCGDSTRLTKLLKFEIDGVDLLSYLDGVLHTPEHHVACVQVGCMTGSRCCEDDAFTSLNDIPQGALIQVGPIGYTLEPIPLVG